MLRYQYQQQQITDVACNYSSCGNVLFYSKSERTFAPLFFTKHITEFCIRFKHSFCFDKENLPKCHPTWKKAIVGSKQLTCLQDDVITFYDNIGKHINLAKMYL